MGQIILLHANPHRDTLELLPWYVAGRLDREDHAVVEAHLSHCASCQAELESERRLASTVARLPLDTNCGWAGRRRPMAPLPPSRHIFGRAGKALTRALAWPGKFGWLLAAQAALALSVGLLLLPRSDPPQHRTLGAAPAQTIGNIIVIFRPDANEGELRQILEANDAHFVDGPTSAGAYVLQVPPARRNSIIAVLLSQPEVVLAQPVNADLRP